MIMDECLMTDECPAFDRERLVCLVRPSDCEFAPRNDAPETDTSEPVSGEGFKARRSVSELPV